MLLFLYCLFSVLRGHCEKVFDLENKMRLGWYREVRVNDDVLESTRRIEMKKNEKEVKEYDVQGHLLGIPYDLRRFDWP